MPNFSNSQRRLTMEAVENNAEPYELKSFSRKLDPENHLKDRMIMRHLRLRKNNSFLDFNEQVKVQSDFGASNE
jgi:hypothetical protein